MLINLWKIDTLIFDGIVRLLKKMGELRIYVGDNPQTVKTRLRQWAQVVACSVRQSG